MEFIQWVSDLFGAQTTKLGTALTTLQNTKPEPDEIESFNFLKAVDAHQLWKNRLHSYVSGESSEKLDPAMIARPEKCVLGKWMSRIGNARYEQEKLYQDLQAAHAQFHLLASQVVLTVHNGNRELALKMLNQGEYQASAIKVTSLLARLSHRCQDGAICPEPKQA
jgi:hypothetical protein